MLQRPKRHLYNLGLDKKLFDIILKAQITELKREGWA
jgi:hypothetical protein